MNFEGKDYEIVDKIKVDGKEKSVILLPEYQAEYEVNGLDNPDGILKLDYNVAKQFRDGIQAFHIIDNATGLGVGFYGV